MVALFCLKGLFCALNVISNVVLSQDAVNIGTGCSQFFLIIFVIGVGVVSVSYTHLTLPTIA